ncbi:MAG: hypothetical protein U0575_01570 [Phycisphaerales bacterium]
MGRRSRRGSTRPPSSIRQNILVYLLMGRRPEQYPDAELLLPSTRPT